MSLLGHASAPGKAILTGEHSVVYGHGAIAMPVVRRRLHAYLHAASPGYGTVIASEQMQAVARPGRTPNPMPALTRTLQSVLDLAGQAGGPDWMIYLRGNIPVAGGMGSSAAAACALVRAAGDALSLSMSKDEVNRIVLDSEVLQHGNPSGVDTAVVVWEQPVWFERTTGPNRMQTKAEATFLLADTGVRASTAEAVAGVAARRHANVADYDRWLGDMGSVSLAVKDALMADNMDVLPDLLNCNQEYLRRIGVSHPACERLIKAALACGASAAKVSGAGLGGLVLVLCGRDQQAELASRLEQAGAVDTVGMELS
ncbi:MAG: mevalonate kinase [Caldilineaceae bacterium SB0666_bin_21]|nr:mevalonate kinase [Caldilineaceae bacterium SB0666_bin_21]